jgi:hypothetical protein
LKKAVREHGGDVQCWKSILEDKRYALFKQNKRSNVDLKDKWKSMKNSKLNQERRASI